MSVADLQCVNAVGLSRLRPAAAPPHPVAPLARLDLSLRERLKRGMTLTRRAVAAGLAASLVPLGRAAAQPVPPEEDGFRVLAAAPLKMKLHPDAPAEAELWAFNGAVPGPTLRVRHGEEVRVRLKNRTPAPLSLHWHGVRIANAMDGVGGLTQAPVAPGQDFDYRFTPPDAGTYLFRPCVPGASAEAAERGLSGLLVVEERAAAPVDREHVVVLDDWRLNPDGTLAPFGSPLEAATGGRVGNFLAVAGKPPPHAIEAAPGTRLRLRLANLCNARTTRIRFDDLKAYVIGVDGQPTESFEPLRSTLPFAPGTRYDVLVELGPEARASGAVTALIGPGVPLVAITAAGAPPKRPPLPPVVGLPENKLLPPAIKLQSAARRDVVIAGGARRGRQRRAGLRRRPAQDLDRQRRRRRGRRKAARSASSAARRWCSRSTTRRRRSSRCTCTATSSGSCTPSTTAGSPISSTRCRCRRAARCGSPSSPTTPASGSSPRACSSASTPACGPGSR